MNLKHYPLLSKCKGTYALAGEITKVKLTHAMDVLKSMRE